MLARNLACAGFILALRRLSRFSTLRHGPILLFTSFMMSGLVSDRNRLPSTFCNGGKHCYECLIVKSFSLSKSFSKSGLCKNMAAVLQLSI